MRVEIAEERLKDTDTESGQTYNLGKGDVITVSEMTGRRWCENGWAKDLDGNVETGQRVPGVRALNVKNAKITGTASTIGAHDNG
jgi:hypothetical protein